MNSNLADKFRAMAAAFDHLRSCCVAIAGILDESDEESSSSESELSSLSSRSSASSFSSLSRSSLSSLSSSRSSASSRSSLSSFSSLSSTGDPTVPRSQSLYGYNLEWNYYWANGRSFINRACLAGVQYGRSDWGPMATFDRYGNLLSGKAVVPIWLTSWQVEPGRYTVQHDGDGSVRPLEFTIQNNGQRHEILLELTGPVIDLTVEREDEFAIDYEVTEAFQQRHMDAGAVRLMDLRRAYSSGPRNGNHYTINNEGSYPILEQTITPVMAHEMANSCRTNLWWNWHHLDSNAFVTEVCQQFKDLGGNYRIYFEVSNEVWGTTPPGAWADTQPGGRYAWLNRRTREVAQIAKSILGDRARVVIGSQAAQVGVSQAVCAGGLEGIDALTIAPYLSYFENPPYPTTVEGLVQFVDQYELQKVRPMIQQQLAFAQSKGLELVCYEGGTDFYPIAKQGISGQQLVQQANASPGLAAIYERHLQWWESINPNLYLFFSDLSPNFGHFPSERQGPYPRGRVIQRRIAERRFQLP